MGYKIIGKGALNYAKIEGYARPFQYILAQKDGKKTLLLRFNNESDEIISGLTLRIRQKNAADQDLSVVIADCAIKKCKPRSPFVLEDEIILNNECRNFFVEIICVHFGSFSVFNKNGKLETAYIRHEYIKSGRIDTEKKRVVTQKRFKVSIAACFAMAVMMVLAAIAAYSEITFYRQNNDTFFIRALSMAS